MAINATLTDVFVAFARIVAVCVLDPTDGHATFGEVVDESGFTAMFNGTVATATPRVCKTMEWMNWERYLQGVVNFGWARWRLGMSG